jgi:hypothetical protein
VHLVTTLEFSNPSGQLRWRRVAAITRSQIVVAGVLFIAVIGMAARPGPIDWLDYIGMMIAVVTITFLMEVLKRRGSGSLVSK